MEDFHDDPEVGRLEIKRSQSSTGYVDVNEAKRAKGKKVYYAKTRLDLNEKEQSRVGGYFDDKRECAIHLAKYLKKHPPKPIDPSRKVRRPLSHTLLDCLMRGCARAVCLRRDKNRTTRSRRSWRP